MKALTAITLSLGLFSSNAQALDYFAIDMQGNVFQSDAGVYYAKYGAPKTTMDNVLFLNKTNNQMQVFGQTFSPNTNLFTVSDIQDVTYTSYSFNNGYSGYAYVKANDNSYAIDMQGNVLQLGVDVYYAKYGTPSTTMDNVLFLNKTNNQMQVFGRTFSPNTNLFTVSDIQDVTYTSYYNDFSNGYAGYAYVAVNLSPAPEPETYTMLLAGLGLLGFTARRRKQSA